tara:strand:+ start:23196 stop:23504 length:309 start_codon:yes stop_codon:yes gene_type:complete
MAKYRSLEDRLFMMSVLTPEGCWVFLGYKCRDGYGSMKLDGKRQLAHRVSFAELKGEIPSGHDVDHQCKNRSCINPDHLVSKEWRQHRAETNAFAHQRTPPP